MELIDLPHFGPDHVAQVEDGESDPYEADGLGIVWRPKSAHVGLTDAGHLIAYAGWVPVQARGPAGEPIEGVGLGSVLVHRAHRGNGIGHRLVLGAVEGMRDLGRPIGLLFCRSDRVSFYEGLGWRPIRGSVTADQPSGPVVMPMETCWLPLLEDRPLPVTVRHIEGLPF